MEQKEAARAASLHTVGNYKARNSVITTLTKYDLIEKCTANSWNIYSLPNHKEILSDFKITYDAITKKTLLTDELENTWDNYFDQALPIIKGFQVLGLGNKKLVGSTVNRGDSEGVVKAMGLQEDLNKLNDGTTTPVNWTTKFLGVASTNQGDEAGKNQYAVNAAIIWILKIGENHHGFDFMEIVGEGYQGEAEITFPMGVKVKITSVKTHISDLQATLRPNGCKKAKYTIYGEIF
ncbi:hypothetical protein [Tenacibaculum sp. nBUS_03]|uniref:hypothetical protein n=1 Tax=Tenacibaculum sp. nBUS_03 TaxID=3395320 RepID=UPI003EBC081F